MTALPQSVDVAVVGAGTAGLTAALVLGRAGLSVAVVEKQPEAAPVPRGEIIQPNGLAVLDRLNLLEAVKTLPVAETEKYRFCRIGKGELACFDYTELPCPHPTTLVLMPETIHRAQVAALAHHPNVSLHFAAPCTGLLFDRGRVGGITLRHDGNHHTIRARMVIGADGALSRVRRQLGVGDTVIRYDEGYLTGLVPRPEGFDRDGYYYLGKGEILGLFPVSDTVLYFFYLVPFDRLATIRDRPVHWLARRIGDIHPPVAEAVAHLAEWRELNFFPCIKVMAHRWFAPGAALVGHAAHSVNPHVAQGRNMAMVDAERLATLVAGDLHRWGTVNTASLQAYERSRRPQATALQQLGDELVLFWNADHPVMTLLRDRAFRSLARHRTRRHRVMAEIAGLGHSPLSPWDRMGLTLGL